VPSDGWEAGPCVDRRNEFRPASAAGQPLKKAVRAGREKNRRLAWKTLDMGMAGN